MKRALRRIARKATVKRNTQLLKNYGWGGDDNPCRQQKMIDFLGVDHRLSIPRSERKQLSSNQLIDEGIDDFIDQLEEDAAYINDVLCGDDFDDYEYYYDFFDDVYYPVGDTFMIVLSELNLFRA